MARALPVPFVLTARAEILLSRRPDLDDTIRRLQAFEKARADVLYAPGLRDIPTIRTVVRAVGRPLNVVMSAPTPPSPRRSSPRRASSASAWARCRASPSPRFSRAPAR